MEDAARLHRMARLKREALAAIGLEDRLPADRAGLETRFGHALATLRLVFQPILRAEDGTVFGYEALTRTDEPSIPHPGALFEAAERLGRVHEVGGVVRDHAAAFLARAPALTLFVNVHAQELTDDALLSPAAALSGHARSVVLELTERSSFEHVPNLRARVSLLRRLGYRLAVDDLGAGYAGLTSFAALNPHVVKLDMSLVRGADSEPVKQRVIASMASLCKEFGIMVVAEGIETVGERDTVVGARLRSHPGLPARPPDGGRRRDRAAREPIHSPLTRRAGARSPRPLPRCPGLPAGRSDAHLVSRPREHWRNCRSEDVRTITNCQGESTHEPGLGTRARMHPPPGRSMGPHLRESTWHPEEMGLGSSGTCLAP